MLALKLLQKFWFLVPMVALLAWGGWERHEATAQAARAAQLEQQLRAATQAQNAAVEKLKEQGAAAVAQAKQQASARAAAAQRVHVVYQTRVQTIEAAPVPGTCIAIHGDSATAKVNGGYFRNITIVNSIV
jgi:hypothetical protein